MELRATLHLVPGSGHVARRRDALLYLPERDERLLDAFMGSPEGGELQALASATVAAGFDVTPFIGVGWTPAVRVMAFGAAAVETDQPSLPMLSGAGSRTWVEHTLAVESDARIESGASDSTVDPATDLTSGVALAGGFRLELAPPPDGVAAVETAPAPTEKVADATEGIPRPPVPAEAAAADRGRRRRGRAASRAVRLRRRSGERRSPRSRPPQPGPTASPSTTPARRSTRPPRRRRRRRPRDDEDERGRGRVPRRRDHPSPARAGRAARRRHRGRGSRFRRRRHGALVDAKLCPDGHANPPVVASCAVCGQFLTPGTATVVHVPRPSLGHLELDDGTIVELDHELLIGRNPDRDTHPERAGLRRVKVIGDKVSRSHLEIRYQGWDVLVADCGSTNGTFVVPHPGGQVTGLEAGRALLLEPGATVYFGSRSLTVVGREAG